MSYILDALSKSEKDRKKEETLISQALDTPRQVVPAPKNIFSSKPLLWTVVLLALLIAALVFVKNYRLPISPSKEDAPDITGPQSPAPSSADGSLPERKAVKKQPLSNVVISAQDGSKSSPGTIAEKDPAPSQAVVQEPAPLTLTQGKSDEMSVINRKVSDSPVTNQLPPSAQADIGKMKFAGHVYSEDNSRRMIMVNNKILREGDVIDGDFHLKEITKTGVILLYKSTPFRIDLF